MNARIAYALNQLRESFWIIPGLITSSAVLLAWITAELDRGLLNSIFRDLATDVIAVDNARSILSTVAGSMITVASLVFSLTVIALTLAAQQLGPRLVSLFVRDRLTQIVLGAFLGTFVYALLSLSTLGSNEASKASATFTVAVAIALALASFALLVLFIHHIALSIQADIVVARVSGDLIGQIETRLSASHEAGDNDIVKDSPAIRERHAVVSNQSGYIQSIDFPALQELATRARAIISLKFRAGQFLCSGEVLARLSLDESEIDQDIRAAVVVGPKRTPTDDIEFGLQAIVEIALRALSPGVNDTFTALVCIDHIGDALSHLLQRELPPPIHYDNDGEPRVVVNALTVDGVFDLAFNHIRQNSESNPAVLIRLIETLTRLCNFVRRSEQRNVLARHARNFEQTFASGTWNPNDRSDLGDRIRQLEVALSGSDV